MPICNGNYISYKIVWNFDVPLASRQRCLKLHRENRFTTQVHVTEALRTKVTPSNEDHEGKDSFHPVLILMPHLSLAIKLVVHCNKRI